MRTTQQQDNVQAKQRLRTEISSHVADFLHKGGCIEVVTHSPGNYAARAGHRPAIAESALMPSLLEETE